jgi:NAD(P)-dependent dehydrogenase (short-subunit alcohol dehydrogenase family)
MRFKGKKAVVVGARDESIGQAVTRGLAAEGAEVCIWDIDTESAGITAKSITDAGGKATLKKVDALDYSSVKSATDETINDMGGVDILVGTVGGASFKMMTEYDGDFFKQQLDFSGTSMFIFAHPILVGHYMGKGEGKLLFFTSATEGIPGLVGYTAAKAVVESVMKSIISETTGTKIQINAILPGIVPTKLTKGAFEGLGEVGEQMLQDLGKESPYGLNTQEEVARVALWLLSDEARRLNGQVLVMG